MISIITVLSMAYAQDSYDAHGYTHHVSDGDISDYLYSWKSKSFTKKDFGLDALYEFGRKPLTMHILESSYESETILVDRFSAINTGLYYSPTDFLKLDISAPLYLTSIAPIEMGFGVGDPVLTAEVQTLELDRASVSLIGAAKFPGLYDGDKDALSNSKSYLKSQKMSGSLIVAGSVDPMKKVDLSMNLGVRFSPELDFYNLNGRESLIASIASSYKITDSFSTRLELYSNPSLYKNEFPRTESPVEVSTSGKGYLGDHYAWTLGAGKALDRAASAATWRVFAGLSYSFSGREKQEEVIPECFPVLLEVQQVGNSSITISDEERTLPIFDTDVATLPCGRMYKMVVAVPEESLVAVTETEIVLMKPIYFDFDKADIRFPDSAEILDALVNVLNFHREISLVQVQTGTDERGTREYNKSLSARRAESVMKYLIEHGISSERLVSIGLGEDFLVHEKCQTEECHEKNRYSRFLILETE